MLSAKAAGIPFEHKIISLNDLLTGAAADRVKTARLPMFKSIGAAIQDIVVAELVVSKARRLGSRSQRRSGF